MEALATGRINLPRSERIKDGRIFEVSKRAESGEIYLRCSTKFCAGTAKKLPNGEIESLRNHSEICFTDDNAQLKADFKDALKNSLARNFWKLRQIYETVAALFPREIRIEVPFNEIESSLKRWRRQFFPECPDSLQAMIHQLEDPQNQRLLEYDLGKISSISISDHEGNVNLLLYDPELANEFRTVSHVFIDGTFQTIPRVRGVYQLVAVLGVKYDHAIPIAHILMSRKTESSYTAVLHSIKATVMHNHSPAVVMTDYEQGLRNATRSVFPHAIVAGCSVHYDRAILKKVKTLRLPPIIRQEEGKIFLKKIMALAYLPASMVAEQYAALKDGLSAPLRRSFMPFLIYYERQWLGKVKPTGFSVFRLSRRTNNVAESYNSILKQKMGQHPSAWTFICQLIKLTANARDDLESLKRSKRIRRHPRYETVFRRRELMNAWTKLGSNEISAAEFLDLTAVLKGHISQALMRLPEDDSEDEIEVEDGPAIIAPEADPDYDAIDIGGPMNNEAEPAINIEADVDQADPLPAIELEMDDELNNGDSDVEPEAPQPAGDDILEELPAPAFPLIIEGAPLAEMHNGPVIVLDTSSSSSSEGEMDDEHTDDDIEIILPQAPQAARDEPHEMPQPTVPLANEPGPSAGTNNVSKSRKRNLRKKRRRQLKGAMQRPALGHKRRAKRRKTNSQAPKCIVCLDNVVTHGFIPCGHNCCCVTCATRLDEESRKRCPKCRTNFTQFIAIFNEPA